MFTSLLLFIFKVIKNSEYTFGLSTYTILFGYTILSKVDKLLKKSIRCKSVFQMGIEDSIRLGSRVRIACLLPIFKCIICIQQHTTNKTDLSHIITLRIIHTPVDS